MTIYAYPIRPGAGFRIQRLHRKILYTGNMPRGHKKKKKKKRQHLFSRNLYFLHNPPTVHRMKRTRRCQREGAGWFFIKTNWGQPIQTQQRTQFPASSIAQEHSVKAKYFLKQAFVLKMLSKNLLTVFYLQRKESSVCLNNFSPSFSVQEFKRSYQ
jgi:hypothetical protein